MLLELYRRYIDCQYGTPWLNPNFYWGLYNTSWIRHTWFQSLKNIHKIQKPSNSYTTLLLYIQVFPKKAICLYVRQLEIIKFWITQLHDFIRMRNHIFLLIHGDTLQTNCIFSTWCFIDQVLYFIILVRVVLSYLIGSKKFNSKI
jgi:hypothetical protein